MSHGADIASSQGQQQQTPHGQGPPPSRLTKDNLRKLGGGAGEQIKGWKKTPHSHEQFAVGERVERDTRRMQRKLDKLERKINGR